MLFSAFRVIYTVNELDSHAKNGQSKKKKKTFECMTICSMSISVPKNLRLILKDGAVPAIKDPGHDSELQRVSEMASNVSVLFAISASARHSLASPTVHLQELCFFRRES